MAELTLTVNGRAYAGWKAARITRSLEAVAGGFELDISDRWSGQGEPWPIREEDECVLAIDGEPVISGYVDYRRISIGPSAHKISIGGRDRTGALVDCSATPGEFRRVPLKELVEKLASPFAVVVSVQQGLSLPKPIEKLTVDPGDTAFVAVERACRMAGVLAAPDGAGGLLLTRSGAGRAATDLVEGENIISASGEWGASERYRVYIVAGQHQGSDIFSGKSAAAVRAEARDPVVRRAERTLRIRPESGATPAYARQRAEWEAAIRAAQAVGVRVTVQGWHQGDGTLWPINALVRLRSPLLGIDAEMLIAQVTYTLDAGGTVTEIGLCRPGAFSPEPEVPARAEPGRKGGLFGAD